MPPLLIMVSSVFARLLGLMPARVLGATKMISSIRSFLFSFGRNVTSNLGVC